MKIKRPINLELKTIQFPVTAICSILHRITGVISIIFLILLSYMFNKSLSSPQGFQEVLLFLKNIFIKFIIWCFVTSLVYHILGGIRHIIMDLGLLDETFFIGKITAKIVFISTLILSIIIGILIC